MYVEVLRGDGVERDGVEVPFTTRDGRGASLGGSQLLDLDRPIRAMLATPDGRYLEEIWWERANETTRGLVLAHAAGVNAWLDDLRNGRNGARLSEEYDFPLVNAEDIPDWEPADSFAVWAGLILAMTDQSGLEIYLGDAFASLPEDVALDLFSLVPATTSTTMAVAEKATGLRPPPEGSDLEGLRHRLAPALPALREAGRALEPLEALAGGSVGLGSNNWAVSPNRTASGNTLLAYDPHLGTENPSHFHLVHLYARSPGLHVIGGALPGLPGVTFGSSALAWGSTNANYDVIDVYVETLRGDGVERDGEEVPFVTREHTFEVFGGQPVTETLRWVPGHGPVIAQDDEAGVAITVAWAAAQGRLTDTDAVFGLLTARSVAEAEDAMALASSLSQNYVFADSDGHLGWFPYREVPQRPWASWTLPPWMPLPGDGSAERDGFVPLEELPHLVDPPAGFIATANNAFTDALADGDPTNDATPYLQSFPASGYRHERISAWLEASTSHDLDSMLALQSDVQAPVGNVLAPLLSEAQQLEGLSAGAEQVVATLLAWEHTCPTGLAGTAPDAPPSDDDSERLEAAGCTAAHVLAKFMIARAFGDELALVQSNRAANPESLVSALRRLAVAPEEMHAGNALFDDVTTTDTVETREQVLAAALEDTSAYLEATLGSAPEEWLWGRVHTLTLASQPFSSVGISTCDNGPYANDGGVFTVDAAATRLAPDDNRQAQMAVARMVAELSDDGAVVGLQLPGGNDLHRDSPFYDNLLPRYLRNEPIPIATDWEEATASAVATFEFAPGEE